jgi:hypothetical protein
VRRIGPAILGSMVMLLGLTGCVSGQSASLMPTCPDPPIEVRPVLILEAQAVPTATYLPCVTELPSGWRYGGFQITGDRTGGTARFWLDDSYAEVHAVEVTLTTTCDPSQAFEGEADPNHPNTRIFDETISLPPHFSGVRYLVFPGGCVSYRYAFSKGVPAALVLDVQQALNLIPRGPVVDKVKTDFDLSLCGAGAPPCHG